MAQRQVGFAGQRGPGWTKDVQASWLLTRRWRLKNEACLSRRSSWIRGDKDQLRLWLASIQGWCLSQHLEPKVWPR